MILSCPQCGTRFHVDPHRIPAGGRTVRCAKCQNIWHQPSALSAQASSRDNVSHGHAGAATAPTSQAIRELLKRVAAKAPVPAPIITANPEPTRKYSLLQLIGAAVFGAVATIMVFIALHAVHPADMNIWPDRKPATSASTRAMKQTVSLRDVGYRRESRNGQTLLVISGTIVNGAERELPVPRSIRISLQDEHYNELFRATVPTKVDNLRPGASVTFRARIHDVDDPKPRLEMVFQD